MLIEQVLEFLYTGDITEPYFPADQYLPPDGSLYYRDAIYQNVRLYAEADYFMIDDLKQKMMEGFRRSFLPYGPDDPPSASLCDLIDDDDFEDVIKEIYSTRADYQELRKVAIDNIKESLLHLWAGEYRIISSRLLKLNPDFTHDLCVATLNKYVVEPKPVTDGQITPAQINSGYSGFASQSQPSAIGAQPSRIVAQPSTFVTQPYSFEAPLVAPPSSFGAQTAFHGNRPAVYGSMTVAWRS
ncbi:uncharacterized protein N7503_003432 [Penicillium pulvis]|uniref:uncharacterized protein n=1 Tax=Penicillium pulvis TaxID=1562058 RepID=UPI0025488FC9|nr:uncharacterized protein N7503_003432 [Penicillium pulvis]KAJ5805830.1 hypothetical protein N7503_003432 [Penicillium pulvis]